MRNLKVILTLFMLMTLAVFTACHDEKDDPTIQPTPTTLSEGIVGKWLLATSTNQEWAVYEFKKSQQMTSEWFVNNTLISGTGSFFTNDEKSTLSGTINDGRGTYIYLNWAANKIETYQIDIDVYGGDDGNQYLTATSLYKIIGEQEGEFGSTFMPEYHKFAGTNDCSDFVSIDESIAKVGTTGEIECLRAGSTYVKFNTPAGWAVIKLIVSDKIMSFSENILGTWVTDNKGYMWERDIFGEDGYFYAQWSREVIYPTSDESAQGTYTVNEIAKTISVSAETPYQQKLTSEYRITKIDKFSFDADIYSNGDKTTTIYYQRVLASITIEPQESEQPNYYSFVGASQISGYSSHDNKVATVDENSGLIIGNSKGITYIDVKTNNGTGVIEVTVKGGAIPYDFQNCVAKPASMVKDMLGTPYYEDETSIIYHNLTSAIDLVGVSLDSFSGLVKGITITYNSNVKVSDVTSILDATFIPFTSQTTETFKAYMDTKDRADATIGVTWDTTSRRLTYVNLATDLFTDYSLLIGMTKNEVISKMGREPDRSNDQSQNYFFYDNKGIKIVSAYYTDFINIFDKVRSVVTMFDDTLTVEQITNYLKKKYPYYPEHSTDEELVFIPESQTMIIYYMPKDGMIMYMSASNSSNAASRSSIIEHFKNRVKIH